MTQSLLPNVLDHIISLTSEREVTAVELALEQSLVSLAGIEHFAIHSKTNIERIQHAIEYNIPVAKEELALKSMIAPLNDCLTTTEITSTTQQERTRTFFPLNHAKKQALGVIVIEGETANSDHALAIKILKVYDNFMSIVRENERDALTGLLNRKTFDLKINNIITQLQNKSDKEKQTFLAIFDIDHFKRINDTQGHLIGDEVLILFSQVMEKNFRGDDLLFRFGGEEFVCLCHCHDETHMHLALNRFRTVIEQYAFPQVGSITVSCGFTKINPLDLASNIIGRADAALYHAKHSGRNQVCQHEALVAQGLLNKIEDASGEIELF